MTDEKRFENVCECNGWRWHKSDDCITISQYSPAGEDYCITVMNSEDFVQEIRDRADNFDLDEHVLLWLEAKRNGVAGVPDVEALTRDARDLQRIIAKLADGLEEAMHPAQYKGKEVYTPNTFVYREAQVGDYVTQDVVDDAMDLLPPASMTGECSQIGEPYSHREDPETGKFRATYATFAYDGRSEDDVRIWRYCGHCFRGENVERGKDPVYV